MMAPKTSKKIARGPKKRPSTKPAKPKHGGRRARAGRPKGSKTRPKFVEDFADVAKNGMPTDELDAIGVAFHANSVALLQVMRDPQMNAKDRRTEIRTISKILNLLVPKKRLRRAERTIRGELERQAAPVDPKLEPAPPAARDGREDLDELADQAEIDNAPDEGEEDESE